MKDLLEELSTIRQQVFREYKWFQNDRNLIIQRKRLIYLFIKDLSSSVCGEVLASKTERDMFRANLKFNKVSQLSKRATWTFIILLNLAMLFYIYLFALKQTSARQSAWLNSFIMWLGFEIFLSSTFFVLTMHVAIPLTFSPEISRLANKFKSEVNLFQQSNVSPTIQETTFNSAKYFFTSSRVACLFPDFPESTIIRRFSTTLPPRHFGQQNDLSEEYEESIVLNALLQILFFFLKYLFRMHTIVQDIVIQTLTNIVTGTVILFLIQLWRDYSYFLLLTTLVLPLVAIVVYFMSSRPAKLSSSIHPVIVYEPPKCESSLEDEDIEEDEMSLDVSSEEDESFISFNMEDLNFFNQYPISDESDDHITEYFPPQGLIDSSE